MNRFSSIVAAVVIVAMASFVFAAKAEKGDKAPKAPKAPKVQKADILRGRVVSVDTTEGTITIRKMAAKKEAAEQQAPAEVVVQTNGDTQFVVNGQEGKLADLAPKMLIKVQPSTGVVTKVLAATPKGRAPKADKPAKTGKGKKGAPAAE